jgi:hypothetical protein
VIFAEISNDLIRFAVGYGRTYRAHLRNDIAPRG